MQVGRRYSLEKAQVPNHAPFGERSNFEWREFLGPSSDTNGVTHGVMITSVHFIRYVGV
jgi:hypothetical protein